MRGSNARRDRATALLVVLAVLALLSTLAVSFARLTALEQSASVSRVEEVRSRFLAFAGMERAMSEIGRAARRPYDGPDVAWFYRGTAGLSAGNGVPLVDADFPSFREGGLAYGRRYSGALPETHEPLGDTYVLKVLDAASMIDLNAPGDPRRPDAEQPLVRMLKNLSFALDSADPPLTAAEAEMVYAYRTTLPGGVFRDRRELLDVPGGAVTPDELELLEDFVTTCAWADPMMVAPSDPALVPAAGADVFGRVPTGNVLSQPRRPVNVNTAPREVLAAVFADVAAFRVDPGVIRTPAGGPRWQSKGQGARTTPVSLATAAALATAAVARREAQPFKTWTDIETFFAGQVTAGTIDELQAAALRANLDSNVNTNRANPDLVAWKEVDKFDLVASTTELAFQSGGIFEIESLGRVTHLGGEILAQSRIRAAVECFRIVRHTVQSQFAQGTSGSYTLIEPILYHPESAIIAEEDLVIQGSPQILGTAGSVHSNSDLDLGGSPYVQGNATATGAYSESSQVTVDGSTGGGQPRQLIPNFNPEMFRGQADYVFAGDGKVYDAAGTLVGQNSYSGWSFDQAGRSWNWSGGQQTDGILYFESDVKVTSNTGRIWQVTLISTGYISIKGKPYMSPSRRLRLTVIAGTDVSITGTPGAQISGVIYAGEQMDLGGNTDFYGAALANGNGAVGPLLSGNKVHGSVRFHYNKDIDPIPYDWVLTDLPTVVTYPEADARATVDGNVVDLPAVADYDGWLGLAPVTVNRSYLGGVPFTDRITARWKDGSLDAELGGGDLAMVADMSGPVVAPLVGPSLLGHLVPDGCYSEWDSVGAFQAADNAGPVKGTIAFWLKPSWDAARSTRTHHLLALSRTDDAGTQSFQFARTGDWIGVWSDTTGFHFERSTLENAQAERLVHSTWAPPAHQWTHVALVYDFTASAAANAIRVYVNGVEMPNSIFEFTNAYALDPNEEARSAITPANLVRLGERLAASSYQLPGSSPEATYDELFCHKVPVDATWVASMYGEGRFFSAGAADYQSPALPDVPVGSEVLYAAWTVRTPSGWTGPAPMLRLEVAGAPIASTADPAGSAVGAVVTGDLRYRIVFLPGASARPFYAVPVVDDVSIAFVAEARILEWEE